MPSNPLCDPSIVGQYTKNTQVILSFGAAAGGFEFAMQLRYDIMQRHFNMKWSSDPAKVYLDAESLKLEKNTSYTWIQKAAIFKMANPFWAEFYQGGVSNAKCMIFLLTEKWLSSENCWQELGWYRERLDKTGNIKPIFVVFPDARPILAQPMITARDGSVHNPADIWDSLLRVKGAAKVQIFSQPDRSLGAVEIEGVDDRAEFRYVCNEVERMQILYHVAAAC